jgi:hypothetical protein
MHLKESIYIDSGYQSAKQYYEQNKNLEPMICKNKTLVWENKNLTEHLISILKEYKKKDHGILTKDFIQKYRNIGLKFTYAKYLPDQDHSVRKDVFDRALKDLEAYAKEKGSLCDVEKSEVGKSYEIVKTEYYYPNYGYLSRITIDELNKQGIKWMVKSANTSREQWIVICQRYYKKYNNLDPSVDYVTKDGIRLGVYLINEKIRYKKNKMDQLLVEKYESMGFVWRKKNRVNWMENYNKAKQSFEKYGYINEKESGLENWLADQRRAYSRKNSEKRLSEEKIRLLDDIGFMWSKEWQTKYLALTEYVTEHGSVKDMPYDYVSKDGKNLGVWVLIEKDKILNIENTEPYKVHAFLKLGIINEEDLPKGV